ncbi:MAG TPA: tyrosinase family protein [Pyrinomonadaceae bacterium]|nr:tyrosinase family protein [Pyrinomonadaceae bacterium]
MKKHSRRRFLTTAGAAASVAILGPSLLDVSRVFAAPFMRRDIGGLGAADPIITGYKTAVTAMKALPATDPRSWSYQAAIHGTYTMPAKTAWNTCEHGTYFFWSWHRMYLYYFERIVRKYSGVYGWTLPYWNYSSPSQRQLPAVFRNSTSSLFVANPNRPSVWNTGAASLPAAHVNTSGGMALINFNSASSSLENTPHNHVHVDIGGWMGDVQAAAQDPVFYVHHSNMDRLWNLWKAQGGGRVDPLSDSTWKNTPYTFFDENKTQVTMTGCDVLRAAEQLNYTYEGEPAQVKEYCLRIIFPPWVFQVIELIRWPGPPVILGADRVTIPLELKDVRQRLMSIAESKTQTVLLKFDEVETEREPGVVWEIYAGLPPNTEPDPEGPYYVGSMSLFSAGVRSKMQHQFKPAEFAFPLDRVIPAALKTNADKLEITIVPSGILINGKRSQPRVASKVRIGRLSIAVENQQKSTR